MGTAYIESQTQIISTDEIMEIDEVYRNQISELKEKAIFLKKN